jgi:hypothetical protein
MRERSSGDSVTAHRLFIMRARFLDSDAAYLKYVHQSSVCIELIWHPKVAAAVCRGCSNSLFVKRANKSYRKTKTERVKQI